MAAASASATGPAAAPLREWKVPFVFHRSYNISFYGLESVLHSFDTKKYGRVFRRLAQRYGFGAEHVFQPAEATREQLLRVHSAAYLDSLSASSTVARITEVPLLNVFPNWLVQHKLLVPMRLGTAGTVMAAELCLSYGWAINLSGGYHHAKTSSGEGFCVYADIPLAIRTLFDKFPARVRKVLIIDLDAHQGNGFQCIFTSPSPATPSAEQEAGAELRGGESSGGDRGSSSSSRSSGQATNPEDSLIYRVDPRVEILDMYNFTIYPGDRFAKQFITYDIPVRSGIQDREYLQALNQQLPLALAACNPDIIFYNAGTDIYERDPLGAMGVSADGIKQRDEIIFRAATERRIPIVMTLSGGYTGDSAAIIADSICNLLDKSIICLPPHRS